MIDEQKIGSASIETPMVVQAPCILCGTFVDLNERETQNAVHGNRIIKVCKECKAAVAFAKRTMKNNE